MRILEETTLTRSGHEPIFVVFSNASGCHQDPVVERPERRSGARDPVWLAFFRDLRSSPRYLLGYLFVGWLLLAVTVH
jgi:hypothetical protein